MGVWTKDWFEEAMQRIVFFVLSNISWVFGNEI